MATSPVIFAMSVHKHKVKIFLAAVVVLFLFFFWSERKERAFVNEIQDQPRLQAGVIDLSKVMGDEWETVCDSHGYDGPIKLTKYDRTYEPVGSPQDGAWGLIFINKDGTYDSLTGSCRDGFDFEFGCLDRGNAKLRYSIHENACTRFTQR